MVKTLVVLITLLIPVAASAQVQTQRDLAYWKPAFQDCVRTTDGSQAGVKGCAGNYQKSMGTGLTGITDMKKAAFTDCVSSVGVNAASVASCHENLLKTLANRKLPPDDFDIACWKPAYLDCVASVGGAASAVPGCYNNYLGCWTKRSAAESTCWNTFNTCLATTASVQFAVTSCHNTYLSCVAK